MKTNFKKLNKNLSLDIHKKSDLIRHIKESIEFLATHNKNYTNKQYYTIMELKEIMNCIEE